MSFQHQDLQSMGLYLFICWGLLLWSAGLRSFNDVVWFIIKASFKISLLSDPHHTLRLTALLFSEQRLVLMY